MMPAGAAGPACKSTVVPTAPMIDDMELIHDAQDGQPHGNTDNGIPGHWFVSSDGTGGTWIPPANKWMGYYNNKLDPAARHQPASDVLRRPRASRRGAWHSASASLRAWMPRPYTGRHAFWAKSTSGAALPVKFDLGTYDIVATAERRRLHRRMRRQVRDLADHSHRMEANPGPVLRFRSGDDDHPRRQRTRSPASRS